MYCPRCGQERISQATSFCSQCGFLLTATSQLLLTDGVPGPNFAIVEPPASRSDSPRWRGIKQGLFLFMLMIVLVPLFGILFRFGLDMRVPWPVGVLVFLFGGGSLLRIAYALLFEPMRANTLTSADIVEPAMAGRSNRELPAGDRSTYIPPQQVRAGHWLDTNDLQPNNVTGGTTKLLDKEQDLP